MPRIPESIRYLEAAVEHLSAMPAEELNEDTDTDILNRAIASRIAGLDAEEAQGVLDSDRVTLEEWLRSASVECPACYFIVGCLSLPDLARLMMEGHSEEHAPLSVAEMSLPPGFKANRRYGMIDAISGPLLLSVRPLDEFGFGVATAQWNAWKPIPGMESSVFDVQWQDVSGKKRCIICHGKTVVYLLTVPGGHAEVQLSGHEEEFDEAFIEPYLKTLRVWMPAS